MTEVTLIQCVSGKLDYAAPAKRLYNSTYFKLMRQYAEQRGNPWWILSAKHGLLEPDAVVEPYDEVGLSDKQGERIADVLDKNQIDSVRIIAGRKYTNPLVPELEQRGIDVIEIAQGMKIGNRMARIKELLNTRLDEYE